MSAYSINLRSENPALLVEFNLPPGSHARIGAASDAEISLPLAGLADYAGMLGRDMAGRVYLADPDGAGQRFVELPAALPLPPYQFVVFHPANEVEKLPPPATHSRGKSARRFVPAAIIAAVVTGLAALIILDQSRKPAAAHAKPQVPAASITPPPAATAPEPKETPKSAPEIIAAAAPAKPELKPEPPPAKLDLEALAQRVAPAVFRLEVKDGVGNPAGTGTAFAISADGLAVTNFHVVEDGSSFTARTAQGAEYAVSGVTATDPAADLALISLKANNLPFLEIGGSDRVKIGAAVAVYGCPQGLTGTLSEGILSARRNEPEIVGESASAGWHLLQITAPISPGSSGSPVIDQSGKVIGVASAILSGKATQNLNLAIPAEAVQKLRKDSLEGLAKGFSESAKSISSGKPKPSPTASQDSAFISDPEFSKLSRQFQQSDWIEMQKTARVLAGRYPEAPAARLYLGYALAGLGLHEAAETEIKRGLGISAENPYLWFLLGSVQLEQFRHADARKSLKTAASLDASFSATWQKLAASYLMAGEYLEAISPMEQLRKLDRAEFERLLGICRSLQVKPPDLRVMLARLDELPEGIGQAAEAPTNPEKLAAVLVASFLRHGEGPDTAAELADYAPTVDPYFDQGKQGTTAILKDITAYRAQWPRRSLRLIGIESARIDDINTLEATFRIRFTASDGRRNRSGILIQGIRYTKAKDRWLVSGIQTIERVNE